MIEGTPNFNAIALMEIEGLNWVGATAPALVGRVAYINTTTGQTYGQATFRTKWGKETLALIEALKTAMEMDVAAQVFMEQPNSAPSLNQNGEAPEGIGEELIAPQV